MLRQLRLYGQLIRMAIHARMQYRSDFLIGMLGVVTLSGVNITLIGILVARFGTLQGWSLWDLVMLYGMWLICHCVNAMFFFHIASLDEEILHGRLDQYLVRPFSPLLQFLGREFNYIGLADLIFGIVAVATAYRALGLAWEAADWLLFAVAIGAGAVIEIGISLMFAASAFWIGRSRALLGLVLQVNYLIPQYPLDIFAYGVRVFITAFVPFAFMNYYPLTVLLDKPNALGIAWVPYLSPLVALIVAGLCLVVWRRGLRAYTSAGN